MLAHRLQMSNSGPLVIEGTGVVYRPLSTIAEDILRHWKPVHYYAQPYVEAMLELNSIHDKYYLDDASDIVARFLCNAQTWRGEDARRVKKELNLILRSK